MLLNGICSGLSKVLLPCAAFPKWPKKAPDSANLARRLNDPAILWHVSSLKLLYALNKHFLRVDLTEGQGDSGVTRKFILCGVVFLFFLSPFFYPPFFFRGFPRKLGKPTGDWLVFVFELHPFFSLGGFKGNQKETHRFGSPPTKKLHSPDAKKERRRRQRRLLQNEPIVVYTSLSEQEAIGTRASQAELNALYGTISHLYMQTTTSIATITATKSVPYFVLFSWVHVF